jgi:hypothetical protein
VAIKRTKSVVKRSAAKRGSKPKTRRPAPANAMVLLEPDPPSRLRGLLPTPPEVQSMLDEMLADRPASLAYQRQMLDYHNMRFYFGGHYVYYRDTKDGVEVLAVGLDEIKRLRKRMTRAEQAVCVLGYADPW